MYFPQIQILFFLKGFLYYKIANFEILKKGLKVRIKFF